MSAIKPIPVGVQPSRCCVKALEAGMQVDADIALERRPLYRWLFDPLYHLQRSVSLVSNGGLH